MGILLFGAEGGTRTHTWSPILDFESSASANSTTSAHFCDVDYDNIKKMKMQDIFYSICRKFFFIKETDRAWKYCKSVKDFIDNAENI